MTFSQIFSLYFGWPSGAVYSNLVASVICVAVAWLRLRHQSARQHVQALALAARHHHELLDQAEQHHKEQMDLLRKQHSQMWDQVVAPPPPAAAAKPGGGK